MAISGDYANPVTVNGYSCRNCTEVDLAKKHIDPAHPKDGPFGLNSKDAHGPAVRFGGSLQDPTSTSGNAQPQTLGSLISLSV